MNILAIETSTSLCSVALSQNSSITEESLNVVGKHSSAIFEQISSVLSQVKLGIRDIDRVVLSAGPGSYTGLRVGSSAIKGLLFGQNCDLFAANTLAGFALSTVDSTKPGKIRVLAMIDARRQHAYSQSFEITVGSSHEIHIESLNKAAIRTLTEISQTLLPSDVVVGTGMSRLPESLPTDCVLHPIEKVSARGLITLNDVALRHPSEEFIRKVDIESFEPDYMSGATWQ